MATATTRTRKPRATAPRTATLTLSISGQHYRIRRIPNEMSGATGRAYRIRRVDTGDVYDLAETAHGPTCDCADATYRDRACKHVLALALFGLL